MALLRLWNSWGVTPTVTLGHSLGEYAALNAAGVLSATDTIYLVGKRAQELVTKCTPGTHAMLAVAGTFVQYGSSYCGMEEVALNADEYEATARLAFQITEENGNFLCNPYWIDSVGHLSGFIINVKEALGDKRNAFVSHGWESLCLVRPLSKDKTYTSYG